MADPVDLVEDPPGSGFFVPPDEAFVLETPTDSDLYLVGSMDGETIYAAEEGPVELYSLVTDPVARGVRPTTWSVQLCNGWQRIGECTAYSFRAAQRWVELGEWSLSTSPAGVDFGYRQVDGEWVQWGPKDVTGVRVVENRRRVFSGFTVETSGMGGFRQVIDGNGERWEFGGIDEWWALLIRLAFPDPTTAPPWGVSHDSETGTASDVITAYIVNNLGASALEARELPGLSINNEGVGVSSTWSARLQPLSELVARIANDAEIGVWLSIGFDGGLSIRVGQPINRSGHMRLSDQDDLSKVEATFVPASNTYSLAGGTGDGASRVFRVADLGMTGFDRRERFSDVSALSDAAEVQQDASTRVRLGVEQYRLMVEVTDEAAARVNYPHDISLGDSVSVTVGGVSYVVPLTAAEFELTAERRRVRPVFGTATPDALRGLLKSVAELHSFRDNAVA